MRIVSKIRDYYDVGQGLGYDASVTYVRTEEEIVPASRRIRLRIGVGFGDSVIGFCGKVYRVYIEYNSYIHRPDPSTACYSIEDLDKYIKKQLSEEEFELYLKNKKGIDTGNGWLEYRSRLEDSFLFNPNLSTLELFPKYNTPIFIYNDFENTLQVNALLRPWGFQKVFSPYQAYQEIEMYVGGVLRAPVNPVPSVPDEIMAEIKGFDQWSFRKPPRGKKG